MPLEADLSDYDLETGQIQYKKRKDSADKYEFKFNPNKLATLEEILDTRDKNLSGKSNI